MVAQGGQPRRAGHGKDLRGLDRLDSQGLRQPGQRPPDGRFGYMFEHDPSAWTDPQLVALADSMREPPDREVYSNVPAGYITLGQFIAHDLTYDRSELPNAVVNAGQVESYATPALDLSSVYGRLTDNNPVFGILDDGNEVPHDGARLLAATLDPGTPLQRDDLLRDGDVARIPDPRNDENILLSQLHLAFIKLHNRFVDKLEAGEIQIPDAIDTPERLFRAAQKLCRWHYQWVVVYDYLPLIVSKATVNKVLTLEQGRPHATTPCFEPRNNPPMIPVEFVAAAFRFGHSMLGPKYTINTPGVKLDTFGPVPNNQDLNGARLLPPGMQVKWDFLFPIPGLGTINLNKARAIDTFLPMALFQLPPTVLPDPDPQAAVVSLALRDLRRGMRYGLPSGQAAAGEIQARTGDNTVQALTNDALGLRALPGWENENAAPLWYFILKEAELLTSPASGAHLGPVGGRIVTEVLLGLLQLDGRSFFHVGGGNQPAFTPIVPPDPVREGVGMGALLRFAGVA